MIIWLWNFQLWRDEIATQVQSNRCSIISQKVSDKKELLLFKQSSLPANIESKLSDRDSLDYYLRIKKETLKLNSEIEQLQRQQVRDGC